MLVRFKTNVKLRSDIFEQRVRDLVMARMAKAAMMVRARIVRKIRRFATRKHGPSKPGDPPHVDTGHLSGRSIFWRMKADGSLAVEIGVNVKYGIWLELGTSKMAARPYLRSTFMEMLPTVQKVVATGRG